MITSYSREPRVLYPHLFSSSYLEHCKRNNPSLFPETWDDVRIVFPAQNRTDWFRITTKQKRIVVRNGRFDDKTVPHNPDAEEGTRYRDLSSKKECVHGVCIRSWGPASAQRIADMCKTLATTQDFADLVTMMAGFALECDLISTGRPKHVKESLLHTEKSRRVVRSRSEQLDAFGNKKSSSSAARNAVLFVVMVDFTLAVEAPPMNWAKKMFSLFIVHHAYSVTWNLLSVFGGAYGTLGRSNKEHAMRAGQLAIWQIAVARQMGDEVLESKCWIYYAENLANAGMIRRARRICKIQDEVANRTKDEMLRQMTDRLSVVIM